MIIPGKLDRGGAINLISTRGTKFQNCIGHAASGYLVEVEKVGMTQMEERRRQYHDYIAGKCDSDFGLSFDRWVGEGKQEVIRL